MYGALMPELWMKASYPELSYVFCAFICMCVCMCVSMHFEHLAHISVVFYVCMSCPHAYTHTYINTYIQPH